MIDLTIVKGQKKKIELNTPEMTNYVLLSAPTQRDSIVDGEGLRTVIWFQGCPHHCPGCHNPSSHDFEGGFKKEISEVITEIENLLIQDGITFSGGEPMAQPEALMLIAKSAKGKGLNIWCFTGYTFEQLLEMSRSNPIYLEALNHIDVLVDGKFELSQKSMNLKFKGSANQRTIDVKKTLKKGSVVLVPKYQKIKTNSGMKTTKIKAVFI